MEQIFKQTRHQEIFNKTGYVKIPWYVEQMLDEVKSKIFALSPDDSFNGLQKSLENPQTFHGTFLDTNISYRLGVLDILSDFFCAFINEILDGYQIVQANVFIKPPQTGYVHAHQNLTIVDEEIYTTLSLWCPYTETNEKNGTMCLVPGSQKRFARYRSTDVTWPYFDTLGNYRNPLYESVVVNKGEVLVFDDSIIHGTDINYSDQPRIVFHSIVKPVNAPTYYYEVDEKQGQVRKRKVTEPDFWQKFIPQHSPLPEELAESLPYVAPLLDEFGVINELKSLPFDKRK